MEEVRSVFTVQNYSSSMVEKPLAQQVRLNNSKLGAFHYVVQ